MGGIGCRHKKKSRANARLLKIILSDYCLGGVVGVVPGVVLVAGLAVFTRGTVERVADGAEGVEAAGAATPEAVL